MSSGHGFHLARMVGVFLIGVFAGCGGVGGTVAAGDSGGGRIPVRIEMVARAGEPTRVLLGVLGRPESHEEGHTRPHAADPTDYRTDHTLGIPLGCVADAAPIGASRAGWL